MASDFVQMRWQQIRAMESQQETEKENIELRKRLANADKNDAAEKLLTEYKAKMKLQLGSISAMAIALRSETNSIRSSTDTQQSDVSTTVDRIQRILTQFSTKGDSGELDKSRMLTDQESMAKELAAAKRAALQTKGDNQALITKLTKAKEEVEEVTYAKSLLMQNCSMMKEQADTLTAQFKALDSKYSASQLECAKLKQKVAKLEALHGEANTTALALEECQKQCASQEEIIQELKYENNDQQIQIANMQLHIDRLTNAIMGNKSHFAKFVELKNENATLQHKLDAKNAPEERAKREAPLGLSTSHTAPARATRKLKASRSHMHAPTPPLSSRGEHSSFQTMMAQQAQHKLEIKKGRPPAEYNSHENSSSQVIGHAEKGTPRLKELQDTRKFSQHHQTPEYEPCVNAAPPPIAHDSGLPFVSPTKPFKKNISNDKSDLSLNKSRHLPSQQRLLAEAAAAQGNTSVFSNGEFVVEPQPLAELSLAELHQQTLATSPAKLLQRYTEDSADYDPNDYQFQADRVGSPSVSLCSNSHSQGVTLAYSPRSYKPDIPQYILQPEGSSMPTSNIQYSQPAGSVGRVSGANEVMKGPSGVLPSTLPALNSSGTYANRERKLVQSTLGQSDTGNASQRKVVV